MVLLPTNLLMLKGSLSPVNEVKYLDSSSHELLGGNPNCQLYYVLSWVEGFCGCVHGIFLLLQSIALISSLASGVSIVYDCNNFLWTDVFFFLDVSDVSHGTELVWDYVPAPFSLRDSFYCCDSEATSMSFTHGGVTPIVMLVLIFQTKPVSFSTSSSSLHCHSSSCYSFYYFYWLRCWDYWIIIGFIFLRWWW